MLFWKKYDCHNQLIACGRLLALNVADREESQGKYHNFMSHLNSIFVQIGALVVVKLDHVLKTKSSLFQAPLSDPKCPIVAPGRSLSEASSGPTPRAEGSFHHFPSRYP